MISGFIHGVVECELECICDCEFESECVCELELELELECICESDTIFSVSDSISAARTLLSVI